jgi:hypothetical protein
LVDSACFRGWFGRPEGLVCRPRDAIPFIEALIVRQASVGTPKRSAERTLCFSDSAGSNKARVELAQDVGSPGLLFFCQRQLSARGHLGPKPETAAADGTFENIRRDRQRCRAMAMAGSQYCYFDNPATQKALEDGLPAKYQRSPTRASPITSFRGFRSSSLSVKRTIRAERSKPANWSEARPPKKDLLAPITAWAPADCSAALIGRSAALRIVVLSILVFSVRVEEPEGGRRFGFYEPIRGRALSRGPVA